MGSTGPRRIALVGHRMAEAHPTGIGRYYAEIATGLAATSDPATHAYTVASTREASPPPWLPPGLGARTIGGPRKLRALLWGVAAWPPVDRALDRPDLVHLLHPWTAVPARAPLVATIHDLMPSQHPEWHGRLESWLFSRGARHVADHAARIVVDSAWTGREVQTHLGVDPGRLEVIWCGIGDEFRRPVASDTTTAVCARYGVEPGRFLVAVGAVSERKNLRVVLRALSQIDPSGIDGLRLLVAGPPGRGAPAIEAEVERLGLRERVRFAGFVAHNELPVLVRASLALVHPSREEGFGLTPLEAMAAGVPAIASNVASVPEVTGTAALLVDPDDDAAWAAAIERVATDPSRRASMTAAGTSHQARFTWARTAADTRAVHDSVLDDA